MTRPFATIFAISIAFAADPEWPSFRGPSSNPTVANDDLLGALDAYGQAHNAFGESSLELTNRGTELLQWAGPPPRKTVPEAPLRPAGRLDGGVPEP